MLMSYDIERSKQICKKLALQNKTNVTDKYLLL